MEENKHDTYLTLVGVLASINCVVLVYLSEQMLCSFYQRYRDVTARIKASSCPSIPPAPAPAPAQPKDTNTDTNEDVQKRCFTFRGLWSQFAFKTSLFLYK